MTDTDDIWSITPPTDVPSRETPVGPDAAIEVYYCPTCSRNTTAQYNDHKCAYCRTTYDERDAILTTEAMFTDTENRLLCPDCYGFNGRPIPRSAEHSYHCDECGHRWDDAVMIADINANLPSRLD